MIALLYYCTPFSFIIHTMLFISSSGYLVYAFTSAFSVSLLSQFLTSLPLRFPSFPLNFPFCYIRCCICINMPYITISTLLHFDPQMGVCGVLLVIVSAGRRFPSISFPFSLDTHFSQKQSIFRSIFPFFCYALNLINI